MDKSRHFTSICTGFIAGLGFIFPWGYLLCILGLVGWILHNKTRPFLSGFLFALGMFGCAISWVYRSMVIIGHMPLFIALLLNLLLIMYLALFIGLVGYFACKSKIPQYISLPTLWYAAEYSHTHFLGGFPWALLGYTANDSIISLTAPYIGVKGCSVLIVLIAALIAHTIPNRKKRPWLIPIALCLLPLNIYSLLPIKHTHKTSEKLNIHVVQPNIEASVKWTHMDTQWNTMFENSRPLIEDSLTIWPEGMVLLPKDNELTALNHRLLINHMGLIVGGMSTSKPFQNKIIGLGEAQGHYAKMKLVPFGEYWPFPWLYHLAQFLGLSFPMSQLTEGTTPSILHYHNIALIPSICFEILFPSLLKKHITYPGILVTITDDSWFDSHLATWQHLQIARMQSKTFAMSQIFVNNTGLSSWINDQGNVLYSLSYHKTQSATHHLPINTEPSFYQRIGDTLFKYLMFIMLIFIIFLRTPNHKDDTLFIT